MIRREFLVWSATGGCIGLAGCNSSLSDIGSKSWGEAFTDALDEEDLSLLADTPIIVDTVSTEPEVRTGLGVLGWTTAGERVSDTDLDHLKRTVELADEFTQRAQPTIYAMNDSKGMIGKMKATSVGDISMWDVLAKAVPELRELDGRVNVASHGVANLEERIEGIGPSVRDFAVQLSAIQAIQTADYHLLNSSTSRTMENMRDLSADLYKANGAVKDVLRPSDKVADAAERFPELNAEVHSEFPETHKEVQSEFNRISNNLEDMSTVLTDLRQQVNNSEHVVESTKTYAHSVAERYFSTIADSVSGSPSKIQLDDIDPTVEAYDSEAVPDDETLSRFDLDG